MAYAGDLYEYKVIFKDSGFTLEEFENGLNQLGNNGWILWAWIKRSNKYIFIFARKKL